jgi:hypothetical protein
VSRIIDPPDRSNGCHAVQINGEPRVVVKNVFVFFGLRSRYGVVINYGFKSSFGSACIQKGRLDGQCFFDYCLLSTKFCEKLKT